MNRAETIVTDWLDQAEHEALFTKLCCGHFALAAHAAGVGQLCYLESKSKPEFMGHIFAFNNDFGSFDVLGYRPITEMLKTCDWCHGKIIGVNSSKVKCQISTIAIGSHLHKQVYRLARQLVIERI